jgi:hypothetical protein
MIANVRIAVDSLTVELTDGRVLSAPISWYPRVAIGTPKEQNYWRLLGGGLGIHWPDLDEDISIENLLAGKPSGESLVSFKNWLEQRK